MAPARPEMEKLDLGEEGRGEDLSSTSEDEDDRAVAGGGGGSAVTKGSRTRGKQKAAKQPPGDALQPGKHDDPMCAALPTVQCP